MQIADSSALREQNWIKARNDFNKQILDLQMLIDEIQRENRWEFVFMSCLTRVFQLAISMYI